MLSLNAEFQCHLCRKLRLETAWTDCMLSKECTDIFEANNLYIVVIMQMKCSLLVILLRAEYRKAGNVVGDVTCSDKKPSCC